MDRQAKLGAFAAGVSGAWLTRLVAVALAPREDEPLVLRWLRAAADHPVRAAAALALLTWAAWPDRDGGRRDSDRAARGEPAQAPPGAGSSPPPRLESDKSTNL